MSKGSLRGEQEKQQCRTRSNKRSNNVKQGVSRRATTLSKEQKEE